MSSSAWDLGPAGATSAHARGLAVGLKNDLDQVKSLVSSFDFAVNEQCEQYTECDLLEPFIAADIKTLDLNVTRTACR